jgi:hypothetical protein
MEKSTLIKEDSLHNVTEDVRSFVTEVNPKFLTTLKYKFNKTDYKEVASLPFNFWRVIFNVQNKIIEVVWEAEELPSPLTGNWYKTKTTNKDLRHHALNCRSVLSVKYI